MKSFIFKLSLLAFALSSFTACKNTGGKLEGSIGNGIFERATLLVGSSSVTVTEGSSLSLFILLDAPVTKEADLNWSINSGPGKFVATSGTVKFAAGTQTTLLQLTTIDNAIADGNQNYSLTLSGSSFVFENTVSLNVMVLDDETPPFISIANVSANEGTGLTFTVTSVRTSNVDVTVDYATSNGTAASGVDYTASTGTLTIPAGSLTAMFTIPVTQDSVYEPNETVNVTLSGGSGYTAAESVLTAVGTIVNDDSAPTISIANVTVTEGDSGSSNATFTITSSANSAVDITVNYETLLTGTATTGVDYTSVASTATILAGATTTTFNVPVNGDALYEGSETVNIALSGGAGYTFLGSTLAATLTISNNDTAPAISIADVGVTEGNSGSVNATFTVTADAASGVPIVVNYATSNGTAASGSDYTSVSSSVTIPVGSTTKTFTVAVAGDTIYENNETFTVTLSGGSGYDSSGSTLTATGTINNDDTAPTLSIANVTVTEGTGAGTTNATFTITLAAASGATTTVNYATSDLTALAASDYTNTSGTATISAGATTTTFDVPIGRDSANEGNETFTVTLSGGAGYTAGGSTLSATGTITNDDYAVQSWDFSLDTDYIFDSKYVDVTSGTKASLKTVNTTANSLATFDGTHVGTVYSGGVLKLDATTSANTALSSTWTPRWSDIIGYWKMDGNFNDSSPAAVTHSGTGSGSAASNGAAKIGANSAALVQATSDYIDLGDFDPVDNASALTMCTWVIHTTTSDDDTIATNLTGSSAPGIFFLRDDVGATTARTDIYKIYIRGSGIAREIEGASSSSVTGRWTHVCFTYTQNTVAGLRLFVNGVEDPNSPVSTVGMTNIDAGTTHLAIGGPTSFFNGRIDDFAIWNSPLRDDQIKIIYNRQRSKYSGFYDSTVIDMVSTSSTWTGFTPITPLPFNKELPYGAVNETTDPYTAISGTLMTTLAAYWPLNGSDADASGHNEGLGVQNAPAVVTTGVLNSAYSLTGNNSGTNQYLTKTGTLVSSLAAASFSAWIVPTSVTAGTIFTDSTIADPSFKVVIAAGEIQYSHYDGTNTRTLATTSTPIKARQLAHVVVRRSATGRAVDIFVNGKQEATATLLSAPGTPVTPVVNIGANRNNSGQLSGVIDEVALWGKRLSDAEVSELYRRGANHVRYQVRSCIDVACNCATYKTTPAGSTTDCDGDAIANSADLDDVHKAIWLGPDGTASTYFSEIYNNDTLNAATGAPTGSVNSTGFVPVFANFPAAARPANNQYFKYRIYMESDDEQSVCASAPCMPEVKSISIAPAGRYYAGKPTIQNATAVTFTQLQTMTQALPTACSTFQISKDGVAWKYWDGTTWAAATTAAQSNVIADFTSTRVKTFASGSFYFKAFLSTNAALTQSCDVNALGISFEP